MAKSSSPRSSRPLKRKAAERAGAELVDMMGRHGPFIDDWCDECLRRRAVLLRRMGDPETVLIEWVNCLTGEREVLCDLANLRHALPDNLSGVLH